MSKSRALSLLRMNMRQLKQWEKEGRMPGLDLKKDIADIKQQIKKLSGRR